LVNLIDFFTSQPPVRNSFQFPLDLFDDQHGHYMIITAYENSGAGPMMSDNFAFYVPGGGQSQLSYQTAHEYTDVKMTRLMTGVFGIGGGNDGPNLAGAIMNKAGLAVNPKLEILYRNTELRTFQFTFLLSPSSASEAAMMHQMIKRLRFHAAPRALDQTAGFIFQTPAEFEIEFHSRVGDGFPENPFLPKIARSALIRIDVDYTPQGEFSTFSDGSPVSLQLTLLFKEMQVIDKNMIERQGGIGY